MSESTLARHTVASGSDGVFTATLDKSFEIWGPNGGYLSAIALRAGGAMAPAGHRPASISVQYIGRADFGPVDVMVETVKAGSAALFFVTMLQDGKRFLTAQVWTTARDQGPAVAAATMPDVPPPDQCRTLEDAYAEAAFPVSPFWNHFDVRIVGSARGPNPDGPRIGRWLRYRDFPADADPFLDAGRSLLLIDTLIWPAHCAAFCERRPYLAPSLDVAAWFHRPADGDWLLLDVDAEQAANGLIFGTARVWTESGALVASGGSGLAVLPPRLA